MTVCTILLILLSSLLVTNSLIHRLDIHNDDRHIFKIERFGLLVGGEINLQVKDFRLHFPWKYHAVKYNSTHNKKQDDEDTLIAEIVDNNLRRKRFLSSVSVEPASVEKKSNRYASNMTQAAYYKAGFVLRPAQSESEAQEDLEDMIERGDNYCIFDHLQSNDLVMDLTDSKTWGNTRFQYELTDPSQAGLYSLIFAHCTANSAYFYSGNITNTKNTKDNKDTASTGTRSSGVVKKEPILVSFHLSAEFFNAGPNYLSAGETVLPTLYLVFFLLFAIATGVWTNLLRNPGNAASKTDAANATAAGGNKQVHRIHYFMLSLVVLKTLTLLFESIRYHYIAQSGASETWSIIYYIFAFMKGIMLFTVILLIGSGYSLMKNYLSSSEQRVISVVLALQVLDNIAMVVLEQMAPGSIAYLTWRDILHLVDIICCLAILVPIVWSIQHLKQAAEADGKAHNNLMKLTLFRQFYVMVVVYIYFTRIAVYLLSATVPFYLLWLGPLAEESAALCFYVFTGYKFQPASDNPYLPVGTSEDSYNEYGLNDADDVDFNVDIELVGSLRRNNSNSNLKKQATAINISGN